MISRRQILTHGLTGAGALALGSAGTLALQKGAIPPEAAAGALLDDASRLNPTAVRGVLFAQQSADATARTVAPLLRRIGAGEDPALAVAGVRHSMGGQSMLAGGWVLDTRPMNRIELDRGARVVRVGAGVTWRDLIPVLNGAGLTPTVMQSNHDFSVGGSLSVNCHGWHTGAPPIANTVRRLRVLTADGSLVTCAPGSDLFRLVLGGYGLFGVILEADLEVWPNAVYAPHFTAIPTSAYAAVHAGLPSEMAYGRLSVDPRSFLEEAILVRFVPRPETAGTVLPLGRPPAPELQRAIFRNSAGSDLGKMLRWNLEREAAPWLAGELTRATIQNQPASVYADRSDGTCDILHEYFVPHARLWDFVRAARPLLSGGGVELLNVTVRDVRRDTHTALAYAREDVFGLVMNFRQERTAAADARMRTLTRALIDEADAVGGTFYLPYRLHATPGQLRRAYPAWDAVMEAKSRLDPRGVFRNALYNTYAG